MSLPIGTTALGIGTLWLVALAIADVTRAWREGGEP